MVGPPLILVAMTRKNTPLESRCLDRSRKILGPPECSVQANRDNLLDFKAQILRDVPQPSAGVFLDCGRWRELRLEDDRRCPAGTHEDVGSQGSVSKDVRLLGGNSPSRVPTVQGTRQSGGNQRFRVSCHALLSTQAGPSIQSNLLGPSPSLVLVSDQWMEGPPDPVCWPASPLLPVNLAGATTYDLRTLQVIHACRSMSSSRYPIETWEDRSRLRGPVEDREQEPQVPFDRSIGHRLTGSAPPCRIAGLG